MMRVDNAYTVLINNLVMREFVDRLATAADTRVLVTENPVLGRVREQFA